MFKGKSKLKKGSKYQGFTLKTYLDTNESKTGEWWVVTSDSIKGVDVVFVNYKKGDLKCTKKKGI